MAGGYGIQVFLRHEAGEMFVRWGPASAHIAPGLAVFGTMVARLLTRLSRPAEMVADRKHPIMKLLA